MAIKKKKIASLKDNSRFSAVLMPTLDDYFSDNYFENWPKNEHWRKRLCDAMVLFGRDSSSLNLIDFCSSFNIPRQRLYTLSKKYPDIKLAFEDMMINIGRNRERIAPIQFVMQHTQYRYDSEWAEGEERKAELSKKTEAEQPDIKVIITKPDVTPKE